jgi:hypothetical protein
MSTLPHRNHGRRTWVTTPSAAVGRIPAAITLLARTPRRATRAMLYGHGSRKRRRARSASTPSSTSVAVQQAARHLARWQATLDLSDDRPDIVATVGVVNEQITAAADCAGAVITTFGAAGEPVEFISMTIDTQHAFHTRMAGGGGPDRLTGCSSAADRAGIARGACAGSRASAPTHGIGHGWA